MDDGEFDELFARHRRELQAHCYRMLGSLQDAEDALQETMVAAWRGMNGFQGRSSVRTWLYRIATNVCLRQAEKRGPRVLSWEHGLSRSPEEPLAEPVLEPVWLDPWPSDPAEVAERRQNIGLAYVAALQHLPPNQRAILLLREVLAYSAEETANLLDTSVSSVNSGLQRARAAVDARVTEPPVVSPDERAVLDAFVTAWEAADLEALVGMLTQDVRFTMPPLPAWFDGRDAVLGFIGSRVFETAWRLVPTWANGLPAYACYQGPDFDLSAITIPHVDGGRVRWIASFVDPGLTARFGLPKKLPADR